MNCLTLNKIVGDLTQAEINKIKELVSVFNYHYNKNRQKSRYYDGNVPLSEVNLGLALPKTFNKLEIGCEWGAKCVDVLASRSMFDGFVSSNGDDQTELRKIINDNNFISEYQKACKDELKFGTVFVTLSADDYIGCKIRLHSPMTSSALWDGEKCRIDCGMAIIDGVKDEKYAKSWVPSLINVYFSDKVVILKRIDNTWYAESKAHSLGMPLMVPMIWNATNSKPFGRSRIKNPVRRLIQGYVRTVANATIGLEFSTSPQKYILGVTDKQYDALIDDKFKNYVGSILVTTNNPETGQNPTVGQFQQGSLSPHVEMLRMLSTQFSAATGLSVTDTGVVNDANPTSSDAILAQSQTLVLMAEQLNQSNGYALKTIANMALAISKNMTLYDLTEDERDVIAHFKNPAMPSVSMTADAALKIASARPDFGSTDTFLEMIGFSQADIRRIRAQEQRSRGQRLLTEVDDGIDNINN